MKLYRLLLVGLCVAAASMAMASITLDTPSADRFCNKLCAIGFHCVPTPSGGICVPDGNGETALTDPADATVATDATAATVEAPKAADMTPVSADATDTCVAADATLTASSPAAGCPPCTILCPAGTKLVQKGNCECICVGHP